MSDSSPAARSTATIVVGLDASDEARYALDWARRFAAPDARIVAVRAWDVPTMASAQTMVAIFPYDFELSAKAQLEHSLDGVDDRRVSSLTRRGRAGSAIVTTAEEEQATLVVVGHRGESRVSLMLGSTANYVLHHASAPVLVARTSPAEVIRRIVVGVDDPERESEDSPSVRALRWAMSFPGVEDIRVLHAWNPPPLAETALISDEARAAIDHAAIEVAQRAIVAAGRAPAGVAVRAVTSRDDPARALIEMSADADLVVVGARGRGGFAGLFVGSTSAATVAHARSSVVVIR